MTLTTVMIKVKVTYITDNCLVPHQQQLTTVMIKVKVTSDTDYCNDKGQGHQ